MDYPLTPLNRLKLAQAFRDVLRVDLGIECVLEGQMGKAFVDNIDDPTVFMIEQGDFWSYFAGDPAGEEAQTLLENLSPLRMLMPSAPGWKELLEKVYGDRIRPNDRYIFNSTKVSLINLKSLIENSPYRDRIVQIDVTLAKQALYDCEGFEISAYGLSANFVERGIGFCLLDNKKVVGVAYASLICSKGIEVSIFVVPEFRRKGTATALSSFLVKYCLEYKMGEPHWDASNPESCKLALRLGYKPVGTYQAYYLSA